VPNTDRNSTPNSDEAPGQLRLYRDRRPVVSINPLDAAGHVATGNDVVEGVLERQIVSGLTPRPSLRISIMFVASRK